MVNAISTSSKRWIACKAWLLFFIWHIRISFWPYNTWQHIVFDRSTQQKQATYSSTDFMHILVRICERAKEYHFFHMNCLRRCIVQKLLLKQYGFYCEVKLGVKLIDGQLSAHAWLEYHDVVINDSVDNIAQYSLLTTIDEAAAGILINQ